MEQDGVEQAATDVVPRWEWRTFGDLEDAGPIRESLGTATRTESDETYVLSLDSDASVKVRDGLLDVKVLHRVDGAGLQLWVPTMKAAFPAADATVAATLEALGVPPMPLRPRYGYEDLMAEVVGPRDDLRAVDVHKSRQRSVLDGCMVEYTAVTAGGKTVRTVAVESPDQDLVSKTIRKLGLDGRPNTCVAKGLRSLIGWRPTRFAVLDVGTNSVKFIVGERRRDTEARIVVDTAVVTRLGEGLTDGGDLGEVAMRRTVDAIAELVEDAQRERPLEIVAVGTAALRQAQNQDAFLQAVFVRCGVTVEVISGPEEARLAYRAAVSALPTTEDRMLVFDSGGGSSQFTLGSRDAIEEQFSVDVGAVRFTELFGLAQATPRATVDSALAAIADDLKRLADRPAPTW